MKHYLASVAAAALLAGMSTSALAAPSTSIGATADTVTTQLPRDVRPVHYDVTVTPDAAALTFTGQLTITIEVVKPVSAITLQAADLAFGKVSLASATGKALGIGKVTTDANAQTASFAFGDTIAPGRYQLAISYSGKINTQAFGLFALDYEAADGAKKRALYTQFENSDARRFIPSWDEPFYKATFSLKAIVPSDEMAVSNLPVASRAPAGEGRTLVTFGKSPKMSTYLLFFGLGDFERATINAGGTEVGVITKRGNLQQAQYALDESAKILPWYNEYFGTPFPLPKLDNIAAPGGSQFFGAMENWGAIFTFERALLLDPKIASNRSRELIFNDAAHEMAHQWFGDLVTMSWWDDLWLNEGFASWMQSRATAHFHPEWHPELDAVASRESAMAQDALATTHPVIHHVATVEEASQAFDSITYDKGQAVIGMLEAYTGSDNWRTGVRSYMKRHAYANTVTDDLWREMEAASGKPITQIAHDFTLQPGIPLVKVSGVCSGGMTQLTLDQGEFTRDRPGKAPLSWHVPVAAATIGGTPSETLLAGHGSLKVAGCGAVVVNTGQTGYYRVLYTPELFGSIARSFARIAPVDQAGILNDATALGFAGQQPMSDMLDIVQNLPVDAMAQIMEQGAGLLDVLYAYAKGIPERQAKLTRLASSRFLPALDRLGWAPKAGEPVTDGNLRSSLIRILGDVGEPSVVAEANRRFIASATEPAAIDPSVRTAILSVVALHADQATWDKLHAMARAEPSAQVKALLYARLGATRNPELADRALMLALTDEPSATDRPSIINAVSDEHPEKALDFVLAHYDTVMAMIDSSAATRFVARLADGSLDPATIGKLETYANAHLQPEARRPTEEAVAYIRYRLKVRSERMGAVDDWLAKTGY